MIVLAVDNTVKNSSLNVNMIEINYLIIPTLQIKKVDGTATMSVSSGPSSKNAPTMKYIL